MCEHRKQFETYQEIGAVLEGYLSQQKITLHN